MSNFYHIALRQKLDIMVHFQTFITQHIFRFYMANLYYASTKSLTETLNDFFLKNFFFISSNGKIHAFLLIREIIKTQSYVLFLQENETMDCYNYSKIVKRLMKHKFKTPRFLNKRKKKFSSQHTFFFSFFVFFLLSNCKV